MVRTMSDEKMEQIQDEIQRKCECLVADRVGRYIPQRFMEQFEDNIINRDDLNEDDVQTVLEGPEAEFYWEAWDNLLNQVRVEIDGSKHVIAQNGDLFAIEPDLSDEAWDMFYV
jgi:hypothetical protein